MSNLPSGPGQVEKARSESVVVASDHDPILVKSPDHSSDTTFTLANWVGTVGTGSVATESDPNTSAPNPSRILRITAKRDGLLGFGAAILRLLTAGDGTSLVLQPWFYDDTQAKWIKLGGAITITTATSNASSVLLGNMAGAKFFVQCVTNNGNVSAFAYDFV
jgi:hypothetical protein